ncbi:MAG TPA: NUDIX domain-containing protein [Candidatus Nanoarchaeia archaeon]|nr:NUDIX domain-containing protein [Candidatus Nanoarchaeia archaeon]
MALREKSAGIILFRRESFQKKSPLNLECFRSLGLHEFYFLLLQYEAGHWDFSKGHIEQGESEQQAAIRELKEETGITKIHIYSDFREKISFFYKRNTQLISKDVVYFLAETKEEKIKLTEHQGYKWLPYEQAIKQVTFKNSQEILRKAKEHIRLQDSFKKLIRE